MQAILQWCGLTAYQATCLSPVLLAIGFLAVLSLVIGWRYDAAQRKAQRRRYRGGRYGNKRL